MYVLEKESSEDAIKFSVPQSLFDLACKLVEELNSGAGFVERFSDAAFCLAVGQVAFVPCLGMFQSSSCQYVGWCAYAIGVLEQDL